ncbi:hypothetical protein D3C80_1661260 [compost metagenome]
MKKNNKNAKGKLNAEQVLKMLKKEGMNVTLEQAQMILEFLGKLASITVSNFLKTKQ